MSTWSDTLTSRGTRATVLRGGHADVARPARMDAELSTTAFAPSQGVDARLTDPLLEGVVERARRAAAEQGMREGHAEGYAAGLRAAAVTAAHTAAVAEAERVLLEQQREEQVRSAVQVLANAAGAFRTAEQVVLADVEDVVAELAVAIARAVLAREVELSADPGGDAVARALALAPEGCPMTVRLHPDDAATLGDLTSVTSGRSVVVVEDPAVERGGCVAEGAGRRIDAQLGPALARVAAVLR
jgi:flagellar assembly protein FliH